MSKMSPLFHGVNTQHLHYPRSFSFMLVILPCKSCKCCLSTYQSRLFQVPFRPFLYQSMFQPLHESSTFSNKGLGAEFLRQSGSCTSENKVVQVYSVCQAYLHVKMYCSSISFIIQLWIPWGMPKQNSCQSETGILSAPMATYSG